MKSKFTLIEMLLVIAIVGILVSILLPSLSSTREATKRAICLSNLSQSHKANLAYSSDNSTIMLPGNAVLDNAQGVDSVFRIATQMAFGAAIPYHQGYVSTPDFFYCPSWTHPYMQKNKLSSNGQYGGYTDEGYPQPTLHYMTSYNYRGVFSGETRAPSLTKDEDSTPYMGDHWCRNWGQYVHEKSGYNILYMGGHAKFNHDRSQTVISTFVNHTNDVLQDQYWDTFFAD